MKKLILKLYQQIEKEQIKNNIHSKYWIFHIESVLVKEEGISKRYLKVLFFNRMMNEHDNLMRLYLNVNGEKIEKDDFVVSSNYRNRNVMGFLLERDLIDEGENVTIESYVVDGKKQELPKEYMVGFSFHNDQQKFQALMDFTDFLTKEMIMAPYFDREKWVCACGYTNQITDPICPVCASRKEIMQELYNTEQKSIVLQHCKNGLKLNTHQRCQEIVHQYVKGIEQKYGIDENELLSGFDMNVLQAEQEQMIDKQIRQYVQKKHICFTMHSSFKDCLDVYYKGICNEVITKDMVEAKLDLKHLREEYEASKRQQAQEVKNRNKYINIGIIVLLFIGVSVVVFQLFVKWCHSYEGIKITNTYDYRKSKCENSSEYDEITNAEVKKIIQDDVYCHIDYSDLPTPQINVEEKDDDMVRPLDEEHVLIQHKEFIEPSVEKTVIYIADLDGNLVYGDTDYNYTLTTYENGRIVQEDIYRNNAIRGKNVYHYEDDNHYTIDKYVNLISDGPPPIPNVTIRIENGKVTEKTQGILRYRYRYEGDNISEVIQEDISDLDLDYVYQESRSDYENGILSTEYLMDWDGSCYQKIVYKYDANGFLLQKLLYDEQDNLFGCFDYIYDYENGFVSCYKNVYDGIMGLDSVYKQEMDVYISPEISFKELYSFESPYMWEEWWLPYD